MADFVPEIALDLRLSFLHHCKKEIKAFYEMKTSKSWKPYFWNEFVAYNGNMKYWKMVVLDKMSNYFLVTSIYAYRHRVGTWKHRQ